MNLSNIRLSLPSGQVVSFAKGITGKVLLGRIGASDVDGVLGLRVDGELYDLDRSIEGDGVVEWVTWQNAEGKKVFWESSAYLLGMALRVLYPDAQLGMGTATDKGFYYEVDFGDRGFEAIDLAKVERKMRELARGEVVFRRVFKTLEELVAYYRGNPYKLDLVGGQGFYVYEADGNMDLTWGALLSDGGAIRAIKLLNVAGAYWKGDVDNNQLTRIYGISFPDKALLKEHLELVEEAKRRDHRKLGASLSFFTFSDKVGLGLPLWLPRGAFLRHQLMEVLRGKLRAAGYDFIVTPHIAHKDLYVTSGHYQKYGEDTFGSITRSVGSEEFLLKSMNCPHHCQVYSSKPRSYRDLPVRLAEFGTVYRYEQRGELHGLIRTRCFTQDDGHIFCLSEQIKEELIASIKLVLEVFEAFGFDRYSAQISVRDRTKSDAYIGSRQDWELAEAGLAEAAHFCGLATTTLEGEAAFYGPKIDFMVEDALGRSWQLGTVQLDYQLPERFGLGYTAPDGSLQKPVMIHRAALGSLERFIGILLEHTGGKLPLSLCLNQVLVLPLAEKYVPYAHQVANTLVRHGLRAKVDRRHEKIGRKIRDAEVDKIPYMLIVGEKEAAAQQVVVRKQAERRQVTCSVQDCIHMLKDLL